MPWIRFGAPFVALALATSAEAVADYHWLSGIKGGDDRVVVESTAYPWSAIGRVNRSVGGFRTGTLVAPSRG